ncbi:MAG TPA: OmpA family protein [Flavobacterium sp.]|uniref:OmpA family protein n=1 Tax=Flavobacterium sp. TaxID=239 RepID=UPI002B4AD645|nr:OmpA family protein [Flavobacterium sp.]HLO73276.1 OmpA family protein [Flavobacterium sp.]
MKNIVFIFTLICSISFSQNKFTVYFDTDSDQLKLNELTRFDDFFRNKKVKFTKLIGYCDYRASNRYNDTLAFNRAKFVSHIIEKVTNQKQIEIEVKGENFQQDANLSLNRKVEIYYEEIETVAINDLNNQVATAKVGDKLVLKKLYFYNRSGIFRPESRPVLEELLAVMKNHPKLKIEIQGHICCQEGTDIENTSEVRALAVYNYLKDNNIDPKRLNYKSFGSTKPIHKIPEKNEEERNENRRVEIQIIEN